LERPLEADKGILRRFRFVLFAVRRCSSRVRGREPFSRSPVVMEAVSITISIEPVFAARSTVILPDDLVKCPYNVDTPR
jgi:hypothetical protein